MAQQSFVNLIRKTVAAGPQGRRRRRGPGQQAPDQVPGGMPGGVPGGVSGRAPVPPQARPGASTGGRPAFGSPAWDALYGVRKFGKGR